MNAPPRRLSTSLPSSPTARTPLGLTGLAVLAAVGLAPGARADVRLPALLSDHAVLQHSSEVDLWGWAAPGEAVTIVLPWTDAPVRTRADDDGAWRVAVTTPAAGGPHRLTFRGANEVVLEDVWCGEVWLCSGQSNMEWNVDWLPQREALRADASRPDLRLFTVAKDAAGAEREDVRGTWRPCGPEAVGSFSATAFLFGRELDDALGDVKIGLIATSWGGTVVEAWTSEATLAELHDFDPVLERLRAARTGSDRAPSLDELQARWWTEAAVEHDPGLAGGWQADDLDDSAWIASPAPVTFDRLALQRFDGLVWFRRDFELDAAGAARDLVLELGAIDDMDVTWVNGRRIGGLTASGQWQTPRRYALPAGLLREGRNTVAVAVLDTGGAGTLGVAGQALGLRDADAEPGSAPWLSLEGDWVYRPGAALSSLPDYPTDAGLDQNTPTALFNGMVAPLTPWTVRGAIWYQGESNVSRARQYRRLFPALIEDWRARFDDPDLPFYWVQIAPYRYGDDAGQAAELREAQLLTTRLPRTGMAVTLDIGNPSDIHPTQKEEVGRRLALLALRDVYGRADLLAEGPRLARLELDGTRAHVHLEHHGDLTLDDEAAQRFTVAGEDRVFHPARVEVADGHLVVWSDAVPAPRAVRYAWGAADTGSLSDDSGLPASSFRTDDWPMVSAER